MHKNKGNQTKDATTSPGNTNPDRDPEFKTLTKQLEATTPNEIIDKTFRASLLNDLTKIQEDAGKNTQKHVVKK